MHFSGFLEMKVKFKLLALASLCAASLGTTQIANANLLVNGGFESGSFSGWTTSGLTCSGVGSNYIAASNNCYGYDSDPGPHSGIDAAYLGTASGGAILSQSFATVIGQHYAVDFYLATGAYRNVTAPNYFQFDIGGVNFLSLSDAPAQGFVHYNYDFIANASSTALTFKHGNVPSFFVLDDVSASVPEPASLFLLSLGLAGLVLARRRKA
jgi:hypothetical protein